MQTRVYPLRDVTNFKDLVESSCELFAENVAFLWRDKSGKIVEKTYREAGEDIRALAAALCARGLEGEKVGVMGANSYDWAISYLAVGAGVGLIVPIDKDFNAEQLEFVLTHSETKTVLCQDAMVKKIEASGVPCRAIPFSSYPELIAEGKRQIGRAHV